MYSLTFPIPNLAIATFGSDTWMSLSNWKKQTCLSCLIFGTFWRRVCESKIDVFHLRDNLRDLLLKRIEQNGIYA